MSLLSNYLLFKFWVVKDFSFYKLYKCLVLIRVPKSVMKRKSLYFKRDTLRMLIGKGVFRNYVHMMVRKVFKYWGNVDNFCRFCLITDKTFFQKYQP